MVPSHRELDIVDMAYSAVLEPQRWSDVLERFSDVVGGHSAAITFQDQFSGKGQALGARLDPEAVDLYFGHFARRNPLQLSNDVESMLAGKWRMRVVNDEHIVAKAELQRSEYYGDFMRRFDMQSILMMGLAMQETRYASLSVHRSRRFGQFDTDELAIARRLQPHLMRAFALGLRLRDTERWSECLNETFESSGRALFLLDGSGRLLHANRNGDSMLAARDGLAVRSGVLCALARTSDRRLGAAIFAAADPDCERRRGGTITIERPGRKSLVASVAPQCSGTWPLFEERACVVVSVTDPEARTDAAIDHWRDVFGLTGAEAKVAAETAAGFEPAAIAGTLALSIHTVRVHLARIMAKTGTHRQAELASLLLRASEHRRREMPV